MQGRVLTTHWVASLPTPFATFNLGLFEHYHVQHEGAPPLDVLISEDGHRELRRQLASVGIMIPQQSHMRENVAADVSNSLRFFTYLFGEAPYGHYYVTEANHGAINRVDLDGTVTRVVDLLPLVGHVTPTAITAGPDGNLYVGNIGQFPYLDGTAKVSNVSSGSFS